MSLGATGERRHVTRPLSEATMQRVDRARAAYGITWHGMMRAWEILDGTAWPIPTIDNTKGKS